MTAADIVRARIEARAPKLAIVLGSGLDSLADFAEDAVAVPYGDLPGWPAAGVSGHGGTLVIGRLGGVEVAILTGRSHYYESGRADAMRAPIETLAALGVERLLLTNAAGSLRTEVGPGRLMLITDHIAFTGLNPLIGETGDARFVDMTDAYDPALREVLREAAASVEVPLAEGVYVWFSGPSFETPAEIRAARVLGGDAVGMSTVPEVILARRFGLRVAAISVITNLAAGLSDESLSHGHTKTQAEKARSALGRLLAAALPDLD
jgi:purine-nucleoside phosphorylase